MRVMGEEVDYQLITMAVPAPGVIKYFKVHKMRTALSLHRLMVDTKLLNMIQTVRIKTNNTVITTASHTVVRPPAVW